MPRTRAIEMSGLEEDVAKALGKRVELWRREYGWRQVDLAQRSDLLQTYISKFELGQSGDPGISRIVAICLAFRRSPCDLLRAAGLLPGPRPPAEMLENMAIIVGALSDDRRDDALRYLHMLQADQERERGTGSNGNGHSSDGGREGET